jgi:hypothetical protein
VNSISFYKYAKDYATHMPIIQRDYVQGRKSDKEKHILRRFLEAILNALNNDTPLSLNFIYGTVEQGNLIYPIDGQQRLTTLYILHWFVALKSGQLSDFIENFGVFTYQTRNSAVEFFEAIREKQNIETIFFENIENIDDEIKNLPWYKSLWSNDPTVNSVLECIKKMAEIFKNEDFTAWWSKLISDSCPIIFQFIKVNEIGASLNALETESYAASTYIKMNARGKPLSDFENAKALIHSMGKAGESFVEKYDNAYIKFMENIANNNEKSIKDCYQLSGQIDKMMMNLLINLYNDLHIWLKNDAPGIENYFGYMDALRNTILRHESNNEYFEQYFELIDLIFSSNLYSSDEFYGYCSNYQLNRPERLEFCVLLALIWKCGYSDANVKMYQYLLDNFHFGIKNKKRRENSATQEVYSRVMYFCLSLASDMAALEDKSPVSFMAKTPDYPLSESVPSIGPLDWKEEYVKALIIVDNSLQYDHFNKIEECFDRRIRIFLIMSGFWFGNGNLGMLDTYIKKSFEFGLKCDSNPDISIKSLFFLFATGYENYSAISVAPKLDKSIFTIESEDGQTELINTFKEVLDYLFKNNLENTDEVAHTINSISENLYTKKDWRSLILTRKSDSLFLPASEGFYYPECERKEFIPVVIKRHDINGKTFVGKLIYQEQENLGQIGMNISSSRRITNVANISISITITGDNMDKYRIFSRRDTKYVLFGYREFFEEKHRFFTVEFDIDKAIQKYRKYYQEIKTILSNQSNQLKTDFIYRDTHDNTLQKEAQKVILDSGCTIDLGHWYNEIHTNISATLEIDLAKSEGIIAGEENLELFA